MRFQIWVHIPRRWIATVPWFTGESLGEALLGQHPVLGDQVDGHVPLATIVDRVWQKVGHRTASHLSWNINTTVACTNLLLNAWHCLCLHPTLSANSSIEPRLLKQIKRSLSFKKSNVFDPYMSECCNAWEVPRKCDTVEVESDLLPSPGCHHNVVEEVVGSLDFVPVEQMTLVKETGELFPHRKQIISPGWTQSLQCCVASQRAALPHWALQTANTWTVEKLH